MFQPIGVLEPIFLLLLLAQAALKVFVFVDAVRRPEGAYVAADKQTKTFWLIVLGLAVVAQLVFFRPLGIINIIGTIAALVYLVDARPALREVGPGGGPRTGPYGPY